MPEDEGESEGRSPPSLVCKGLLKGLPPGVSFGDSHARRPTPSARAVGPRAEPGHPEVRAAPGRWREGNPPRRPVYDPTSR